MKNRLLKSFDLMLDFYGYVRLEDKGDIKLIKGGNYDIRIQNWVRPYNHNFLRITRILKSLTILGLSMYAVKLLEVLQELYSERQVIIGKETLEYWKSAIKNLPE